MGKLGNCMDPMISRVHEVKIFERENRLEIMYQTWSALNGDSFGLKSLSLMCTKCITSMMRDCLGLDVSLWGGREGRRRRKMAQAISHSQVSMN